MPANQPSVSPRRSALRGVRIGQGLEPEVANRRSVDRPVEPIIRRRADDPIGASGPVWPRTWSWITFRPEPMGLIHQWGRA